MMSSFAGPMGGIGNPMRQSKRLYVGNVQLTCNEQNLADFFNNKMIEQKFTVGPAGDPVVAVQLNHEKSYAFIEVSLICARRDRITHRYITSVPNAGGSHGCDGL